MPRPSRSLFLRSSSSRSSIRSRRASPPSSSSFPRRGAGPLGTPASSLGARPRCHPSSTPYRPGRPPTPTLPARFPGIDTPEPRPDCSSEPSRPWETRKGSSKCRDKAREKAFSSSQLTPRHPRTASHQAIHKRKPPSARKGFKPRVLRSPGSFRPPMARSVRARCVRHDARRVLRRGGRRALRQQRELDVAGEP